MKSISALVVFIGVTLAVNAQPAAEKLVRANTAFAFNLLSQVAQAQPGANIFISPYSASSALQMVALGAVGETKAEMQHVLQTAGMSESSLNTAVKDLNQQLQSRKDVTLNLANGIWIQDGMQVNPAFADANRDFYGAKLGQVNFEQPNSAETINHWAVAHTAGKINDVVAFPFPPLTRMILADAIYFKGTWVTPFKKSDTRPHDFFLPAGGSKQVQMMSQNGRFDYKEGDDYQAVKLPYNGGLQMELYLPRTTNGNPPTLASKKDLREHFGSREGTVMLPRFKMDYCVSLNAPLQAMGMKQAFRHGANFSGIASDPLFIGEVKQKSYVDVNEKGTEAAAVTVIRIQTSAMIEPRSRFQMVLDHPFFFLISDTQSGSILFMGIVNDPASNGGG